MVNLFIFNFLILCFMNSPSFKIYNVIYFLTCFLSMMFIDNDKSIIEMGLKILTLVVMSFMYLTYATKINYWYLLILMFCIATDALFIFDQEFLNEGALLVVLTRFTYLIILRKTILSAKLEAILSYLIPSTFVFVILSYLFYPYVEDMLMSLFIICFLNLMIIGVSFYKYLNKMTRDNLYFMLGIILIGSSDFLIAFNKYLDYQLYYVITYTVMYYIARYLICIAMINEKKN